MFHIVVLLFLKGTVAAYGLPRHYQDLERCTMAADSFSTRWTMKHKDEFVEFICERNAIVA